MKKILITDEFPAAFVESMRVMDPELLYLPDAGKDELILALEACEVLVFNSRIRIDREVLDRCGKLQLVCRAGIGLDHIDLPLLAQRGVEVFNTKGANANAVGEHTVGMLLALRHRICRAAAQVRQKQWLREENRGFEIGGKVVGLFGYGNTGRAAARRLSGFGCDVMVYDKYRKNYGDEFAREASPDEIFASAEIVSLHIPLDPDNHHFASASFFASFKNSIWFLNLSRGGVTDTKALLEFLENGKIIAAGLDVLENEKIDQFTAEENDLFKALTERENVIITPHIGGWTHESRENINHMILERVRLFFQR